MSAWTRLRNDLIPLMWIKHGGNRKDWARRAAMALAIGTGAGAAGYGPMAGLLGGAGTTGAAAGGAAAGGAGGVATGALGSGTSLAGTGLLADAALGTGASTVGTGLSTTGASMAAPASFMNPGLLGTGPQAFTAMSAPPSVWSQMASMGGTAMDGLSKASKVTGIAQAMSPQPAPPPSPSPPPPRQQPLPTAPLFGDQQMAPPGIDPNQWAQMTPEQKRAFMAQRGNV